MRERQKKYRHEYKYLIDERDRALLYQRLKNLIPLDTNAGEEGHYWIRSVYFDDYRNSCFYQNEDGINERAKYRIRIYNVSDRSIKLERKSKKNGMTLKESATLSRAQCEQILRGIPFSPDEQGGDACPLVLRQFMTLMHSRGMRAKTVVEYERIPFVYPAGNVRITFDRNITSSLQIDRFFEKDNLRYPILPRGQQLLEVKFDEYFPGFIRERLETGRLRQISFSKYYLSRKYTVSCAGGRLR